jgi:hypothetical protein
MVYFIPFMKLAPLSSQRNQVKTKLNIDLGKIETVALRPIVVPKYLVRLSFLESGIFPQSQSIAIDEAGRVGRSKSALFIHGNERLVIQ